MKILLCGSNGQLGAAIKNNCPKHIKLYTKSKKEIDIGQYDILKDNIKKIKPDIIINAAAYTDVDLAEKNKILAKQVNCYGAKNLALISEIYNIKLIHFSTDYVFDGNQNIPYLENDCADPISYYGKTKLMGESAIMKNMDNFIIIRVSWLYGPYKKNFLITMLNKGLKKKELKIVNDQFSSPTSTLEFSKLIWIICDKIFYSSKFYGLYHYCGSGDAISWYDFAKEIFIYAKKFGYNPPKITPISSDQFTSIAKRPKYSCLSSNKVLNTFKFSNQLRKNSISEVLEKFFNDTKLIT